MSETWRCDVTGNPVGTDTRMIGAPDCQCQGCRSNTLIEEQAARIEELEQKLRSAIIDTLAVTDTNAELAGRLIASQARISEALKVLERIVANYEDGATFSGTQCADIANQFISTIGENKN